MTARPQERVVVARQDLDDLFRILAERGYQVIGPTIREGAVVYDEVASSRDLPAGWTDEQEGGHYRLKKRDDDALFGYVVGPQAWKKFLHPPVHRLWTAKREDRGFSVESNNDKAPPKYAFVGVRSCELHAIAIQDRVFMRGQYIDPVYKSRRENVFIVAVNCGQAGGTCFCASMNTGPRATAGYDLVMTELLEGGPHRFLIEVGTLRGLEVLSAVPHEPAGEADLQGAEAVTAKAAGEMGRTMEADDVREVLFRNHENPRWDNVAERCLTCANCTMVCPTCFCTTVEDVTDLTGEHAERWRKWDSCFTVDFSYIHGGSVRATAKSRYRQWMTHKLASWIDQFGTSGCVGCGRCITWCPVGIDITEEVRAIRDSEAAGRAIRSGKEWNDTHT